MISGGGQLIYGGEVVTVVPVQQRIAEKVTVREPVFTDMACVNVWNVICV